MMGHVFVGPPRAMKHRSSSAVSAISSLSIYRLKLVDILRSLRNNVGEMCSVSIAAPATGYVSMGWLPHGASLLVSGRYCLKLVDISRFWIATPVTGYVFIGRPMKCRSSSAAGAVSQACRYIRHLFPNNVHEMDSVSLVTPVTGYVSIGCPMKCCSSSAAGVVELVDT